MITDIHNSYKEQVKLLLQLLPYFMKEPRFALKGGTAINLFYQNMPRLSVDIDLTYLPIEDRNISLKNIDDSFNKIMQELKNKISNLSIRPVLTKERNIKQLIFSNLKAIVKVEINHVLRGTVYECTVKDLCPLAEKDFNTFIMAQCLSYEDLYSGKMCAALDRQHPRDLFDIKLMLESRAIDQKLMNCFIIYLISNNRPIFELLNPNRLDFFTSYKEEFQGMCKQHITIQELFDVRETLIKNIIENLTNNQRQFLINFKTGNPNWELLELDKIKNLPAIKWKLQNIRKMKKDKHDFCLNQLKKILE